MKLEFRIPISPRPEFYAQIRLIAQSLRSLGGHYADAKIQVSVGDRPLLQDVLAGNPWARGWPVEWRVVPDAAHAQLTAPQWASGHGRYAASSDADIVVLCDADTCPVAAFDELLARMHGNTPVVAGLQAHYTPFKGRNDATWRELLDAVGGRHVPVDRPYSMDVRRLQGSAPAYFNYGFVAFNAAAFGRIAAVIDDCLAMACHVLPQNPFAAQIALTLAMVRTGVDILPLGHEHNCANDDLLLTHGLVRPDDVRVIHYLRGDDLARHEFLRDRALFEAFVSRERANAINERLRRHLLALPEACAAETFA